MVLGIVQDDNTGTGISKTVLFDVPSKTQLWRVLLWWWSLWSWMWFLSLLAQCLVYGVWYATLRERSGSIHHSWASISALCLCGAESSLNHWPFAPGLDRCPRSKSLAVYFGHLPPTVVNQHDLCRYYRRCWTMCVCVCVFLMKPVITHAGIFPWTTHCSLWSTKIICVSHSRQAMKKNNNFTIKWF